MILSEPSASTSADSLDWTRSLPDTDHVRLFRSVDWAAAGIGRLRDWGPSLRFAAHMVFADSRGACVYWGSRRVAFYNEAFAEISQAAHPQLMGSSFDVAFPELSASIEPIFQKAKADGVTVDVDHIPLFVQRNGILEENYYVGQFIPLTGDGGGYGFYNTCHESTFRVLHDRRRLVLDRITALPSVSVSSTFERVADALRSNPKDVPMLLVYSASSIASGDYSLRLRGSIGVPEGHKVAPQESDLYQNTTALFSLFRKAQAQKEPLVVSTSDNGSQEADVTMFHGIDWVGHEEPADNVVISPLKTSKTLFGFLVLGINPRRPYDVPYQQFIHDLTQQLLAKLTNAVSIEEARRREESLIRDLAESEARIRDIAMNSPVGMISHNREGEVVWANQKYYDILGISKGENFTLDYLIDLYHPDDVHKAHGMWDSMVQGSPYVSTEMRLKRRYVTPDGSTEHAWVLVHGFCNHEEGRPAKYFMACLTDISRLKWAETIESRNAAAAEAARRKQEEFIDLISHELRNPLGAIAIGAETIAKCLTSAKTPDSAGVLDIMCENAHIAETILACAAHQKRIIDDVLLLSRLESLTLTIAPVPTNLETLVESARRMFNGECMQNDIALEVVRHPSCTIAQLDLVMCDPSRLMQIIINLLANGIKFVRPEANRELSLTYGAARSVQDVHALNPTVRWCPSSERPKEAPTEAPDWGEGQSLYVFFAIRDTGPGIGQKEIDHLFQRFAQTSRLTHVHYGGSGLGLYISRELTEKHGGEIGIASHKGAGSTFTFYIKTHRVLGQMAKTNLHSHQQLHHLKRTSQDLDTARSTKERMSTSHDTKLSILLAEDNLVNQKFMARGLQRNDYFVQVANHGQEAIDILKLTPNYLENVSSANDSHDNIAHHAVPSLQPSVAFTNHSPLRKRQAESAPEAQQQVDLILMDWEMPILDGLTASKRIRLFESKHGISPHRRIPIIGITANARQEQIQMALDAGMDDVLPKPFLVSEMVAKIEEWRGRMEARRAP